MYIHLSNQNVVPCFCVQKCYLVPPALENVFLYTDTQCVCA